MEKRTAAIEDTRRRIVQATMELHGEKGILATTMQDIAVRAGVALGTVYRHFPTLDELVPACGGLIVELNPPPGPDVFAALSRPEERYAALVSALFAYYSRGERQFEVAMADSLRLPVLARWVEEAVEGIATLVRIAMEPLLADDDTVRVAIAMSDFRTWKAMKDAGLSNETAAANAISVIAGRFGARMDGGEV
jgi:AcrR family transcriptional regulator